MATIACNLNAFPDFEVTERSIRDRFGTITNKDKAKTAKEVNMTYYSKNLFTEESDMKAEGQSNAPKTKANEEKQKAVEIRQKAMETVGTSKKRQPDKAGETKEKRQRRTGNETITWRKTWS